MQNDDSSGLLWAAVALVGLLLLGGAGYLLRDYLMPKVDARAQVNENCDLRAGACTAFFPQGGKVTFAIDPKTIPLMKNIHLTAIVDALEVSQVNVEIVGINMEMGYNRTKLEKISKAKFRGKTVLPVCVRSRMEWEARVMLDTTQGLMMAPFRFYTQRE